jgi:hypothetical protein
MPLIAGITAMVAVFVLAIGGYWVYVRLLYRPAVAPYSVLPADTVAYLTVDPSPPGDQKEALDAIRRTFEARPGFREAWSELLTALLQQYPGTATSELLGLPGTPDLHSIGAYLGDRTTIAVLPLGAADLQKLRGMSAGGDSRSVDSDVIALLSQNLVGIVDLNFNPVGKAGSISELKRQIDLASGNRPMETYRDIAIYSYTTTTGGTTYFTVLEGTSTAVVASRVEPLRVVIEQFREETGLHDNPLHRWMAGEVPQERFATLYVNFSQLNRQLRFVKSQTRHDDEVASVSGALLVTLAAHPDGLRIDVASNVDAGGAAIYLPSARPDVSTLFDVPRSSAGFVTGTDLGGALQLTLNTLRTQGDPFEPSGGSLVASALEELHRATGLDPELDVIPLLKGDYVLSVAASDGSGGPRPPLARPGRQAITVVFQLKLGAAERGKAVSVLDRLASSSSGTHGAGRLSPAGGQFYDLTPTTAPEGAGLVAGVTATRDRLIIVYDDAGVQSATMQAGAVSRDSGRGFGSLPEWRDIARHLPYDSGLISYIDVARIRPLIESRLPDDAKVQYARTIGPLLEPVRYVLLGSASRSDSIWVPGRNHTVVFVGIAEQ